LKGELIRGVSRQEFQLEKLLNLIGQMMIFCPIHFKAKSTRFFTVLFFSPASPFSSPLNDKYPVLQWNRGDNPAESSEPNFALSLTFSEVEKSKVRKSLSNYKGL
jgi:hypothetical protein